MTFKIADCFRHPKCNISENKHPRCRYRAIEKIEQLGDLCNVSNTLITSKNHRHTRCSESLHGKSASHANYGKLLCTLVSSTLQRQCTMPFFFDIK